MPETPTPEAPKSPAALRDALEKAQTGLATFEMRDLAALRITGDDRVRWLHAQCTQDVKALAEGSSAAAWVLDAAGRNLGSLLIAVHEDALDVVVPASEADALVAHWRKFVIAEDVAVARSDATVVGLAGLGAVPATLFRDWPAVLRPRAARVALGEIPATVVNDPSSAIPVWMVLVPAVPSARAALDARLDAAGAVPMHASVFDALRVRLGRPRFGVDVDASFLPKECGDEITSVSYTKGCYTGQEVVAKLHFLGKPRRLLRRVAWKGGPVAPGTAVVDATGTTFGRLTSAAPAPEPGRWVGLAVAEGPRRLDLGLIGTMKDVDDEPVSVAFSDPTILAP